MPAVIFYDAEQVSPADAPFTKQHPNVRWVPWEFPVAADQREKMVTGFVHIPAREVGTPWYLKLDTDTVATASGAWIEPTWFTSDVSGRVPVFVAAKWSYSKPRDVIARLDAWGDDVHPLKTFSPLRLIPSDEKNRVYHHRIISWIFFGRTDWTRTIVNWIGRDGRLPCPSQDTLLFYCAKRCGDRIVRERMTDYGWRHLGFRKIRGLVGSLGVEPAKKFTDCETE